MKKDLDILFVHPNSASEIYQELSGTWSAIEPPIWASLLAKSCLSKGFNAEIMDCEAVQLNDADALYHIKNLSPRIACFVVYGQQPSASSQNMEGAIRLAAKIKEHYPEIYILFVGGTVSALSKEILEKHPFIDFACQNEGVYTILDLLKVTDLDDTHQLEKVLGLAWQANMPWIEGEDSWQVNLNPPAPIVPKEKLSIDLPGMAWDLLPMNYYRTALWHSLSNNTKRQPFASLYTSLGCPFACSFCCINAPFGKSSFRYWDPEFIIKEFDEMASRGIVNVKIADELFVMNPNHFLKLCDLIIHRGYKFNIWCYARVDTVKEKYLDKLKRAGVNWLALGIESANKKIRTEVIKGQYEDVDIQSVVKSIKDAGINIMGNYIFGLPEDNLDTMQETFTLARELNTEGANFYSAMAYPGSPLYAQAVKEGIQLPDRYSGYSQHSYYTQPLSTKYLTAAEVLKFRDEAWYKYHTGIKYLELINKKFGPEACATTLDSAKIKLKRKILGD